MGSVASMQHVTDTSDKLWRVQYMSTCVHSALALQPNEHARQKRYGD